jgi:hypothetical protein
MLLHTERVLNVPCSPYVTLATAGRSRGTVTIDRSALDCPRRCKSVLQDCGIDPLHVQLELPHIVPEHRAWVYAHAWTIASYLILKETDQSRTIAAVLTRDERMLRDRRVVRVAALLSNAGRERNIVAKITRAVLECSMRGYKVYDRGDDEALFVLEDL